MGRRWGKEVGEGGGKEHEDGIWNGGLDRGGDVVKMETETGNFFSSLFRFGNCVYIWKA